MRAVVVGGGLAGLTAALDLHDAGWETTVLEARPRLGGATASFVRDGLHVDTGQHVFLGCCTAYNALLDRLGVAHLVTRQPRLDVPVWVEGRRKRLRRNDFPAPLHLGPGLLRYLGPGALRVLPALRIAGSDDETFGSWLRAHGQDDRTIERLWSLFTVATLNCAVDEASLALAATVVRTGLLDSPGGADLGWSDVPLSVLHGDAFARLLPDVQTGAKVLAVDGRTIVTEHGAESADAVVVAVPHHVVHALVPSLPTPPLGSSPIVNVHVRYDRRVLDEPFLATVGSPLQWVFDRTASSGADRGQYLAVSLSAADDWLPMRSADVLARLLPELARVLPAARDARVLDAFVTREPHATFRQAAGSQAGRSPADTGIPGLVLAGAWTDTGWPATMEGAVRSGHAAAAHLLGSRELVAA